MWLIDVCGGGFAFVGRGLVPVEKGGEVRVRIKRSGEKKYKRNKYNDKRKCFSFCSRTN